MAQHAPLAGTVEVDLSLPIRGAVVKLRKHEFSSLFAILQRVAATPTATEG
jgi:hypothetical protein